MPCSTLTKIRMAWSDTLGPVQEANLGSDLHGAEHRDTLRAERNAGSSSSSSSEPAALNVPILLNPTPAHQRPVQLDRT